MRSRRVALVLAATAVAMLCAIAAASSAQAHPSIPGIPDCKDAPTAQLPGDGVTGFLDAPPSPAPAPGDPWAPNPTTSVYEQYGYAGLTWHTYDLGCGGDVRDMGAASDTMLGNAALSVANWGTAATNGLHNTIARPDEYMAPLDDVVGTVTSRVHDAIWSPWGGAALLGVVVLLLFYSAQGRLSDVTRAAAWAILVITVMAGLAQYPARVSSFFDQTITGSIASVNAASSGLASLPATSDPARAQGSLLVDRVLYDAWLRGELGSSDSPAARRWGPALFRASAYSWTEAKEAKTSPDKAKELADAKAAAWKDTAQQIQDQDPTTYAYLQGKVGGRLGTGVMTVFGATFTGLFRLVSDLFTFAGLAMLRLLVMLFPAVAVLGVLAPLSGIVRRVANIGGASVVNVIAFAASSSVHTTVVSAILSRARLGGMNMLALVLCLVVTIVAFVLMFPLLSLTNIVGLSHGGGVSALRRAGRLVTRYAVTRQAVHDGTEPEEQEEAPAPPAGSDAASVRYRVVHLPPEVFSRPDAGHRPVLAGTAGPATGLTGRAMHEPRAATLRHTPHRLLQDNEHVIEGTVVDQSPANLRRIASYDVHDSQTEVRRDGVGPRIYDPATKSTVLVPAGEPDLVEGPRT